MQKHSVFSPRISLEELNRAFTCDSAFPFARREFAAEIESDDAANPLFFRRHLTFFTVTEMWRWTNANPVHSLHIGACTVDGEHRRELVFDFDVTDMKSVCACDCAEARTTCHRCWLYARLAMHCIERVLSVDLGVRDCGSMVDWFFSGNRGFHCYVRCQRLGAAGSGGFNLFAATKDQRRTLAELFVYAGNSQCLSVAQRQLLPEIRSFYRTHIYPTHCAVLGGVANDRPYNAPDRISDRDLLALCWPKLDIKVSTDPCHLLRAPYSINPKSGHYVEHIPTDSVRLLDYVPAKISSLAPTSSLAAPPSLAVQPSLAAPPSLAVPPSLPIANTYKEQQYDYDDDTALLEALRNLP